jgi:molecular chaperone IbpA
MHALDFSPLYRSTVGFDRLFNLLDSTLRSDEPQVTYPPYNIEVTGEDKYRVTFAVAGFAQEELTIEQRQNTLFVSGKRGETKDERQYLHRGIATRSFERRIGLADHVKVAGASLENGLLHIDLVREIPEEAKARRIEIGAGKPQSRVMDVTPNKAA